VPLSQVDSSLFDSAAPAADQVKSPTPGNALRNNHEGRRRTSAVIGARNQEGNHVPGVPQREVTPSTPGNQAAAEADAAADTETSLNPPLTLRFTSSSSSELEAPVRPRLNLSWGHPPVALNPGVGFVEELARQQQIMQQASQHPSRRAAPAPREKTKAKNPRRSGN